MTKMIQNADEVMTPDAKQPAPTETGMVKVANTAAMAAGTGEDPKQHSDYDNNGNDDDDDDDDVRGGGYFDIDDDDDDDDDVDDDSDDTTMHKCGSNSEIDILYSRLSTYEANVDKERFREFEEILADCDEVLKESDRCLSSLDSIRNIISLDQQESDNDDDDDDDGNENNDNNGDDDDNVDEDVCKPNNDNHHKNDDNNDNNSDDGDDNNDGDNKNNLSVDVSNDGEAVMNVSDDSQDTMTESITVEDPAQDLTAIAEPMDMEDQLQDIGEEISTSMKKKEEKKKRPKLGSILKQQMLETSGYYDDLISRQTKATEESKKVLGEGVGGSADDEEEKAWAEKVTAFEREKSICEQVKQTRIEAIRKWEEDYKSEVEADLIDQQELLDHLTAQLSELKQQLEISKQEQFEVMQRRQRTSAATKIQRAYRRFCAQRQHVKTVQEDAMQLNQALGERDMVEEIGGSREVGAMAVGLAVGAGDAERQEEKVSKVGLEVEKEEGKEKERKGRLWVGGEGVGDEGMRKLQKQKGEKKKEEEEEKENKEGKKEEKNVRELKKEENNKWGWEGEEGSRRKLEGEEVKRKKLEVEGESMILKKEEEDENKRRSREEKLEEKKSRRCLKDEEEVKGSEKWETVEGKVGGKEKEGKSVSRSGRGKEVKDCVWKERKESRSTGNEINCETNEQNWKKNLTENERGELNEGLGKKTRKINKDGMRKDEEKAKLTEFEGENSVKEFVVTERLTDNGRREMNEGLGKKMRKMSKDGEREKGEKEILMATKGENVVKEQDQKKNLTEDGRKMFREASEQKTRKMDKDGEKKEEEKERLMVAERENKGKKDNVTESLFGNWRRELNEGLWKKTKEMNEEVVRKKGVKESLMKTELENKLMKEKEQENLSERDRKMLNEDSGEGNRRKSEEGMKKERLTEPVIQNGRNERGMNENLNEKDGKEGGKNERERKRLKEEETKRLKEIEGEKKMKKQDGKEFLNEKDQKTLQDVSGRKTSRMSVEEGIKRVTEERTKGMKAIEGESKMNEQGIKENSNENDNKKVRLVLGNEIKGMSEEGDKKEEKDKRLKDIEGKSNMKEQDRKMNLIDNESGELNESLGNKSGKMSKDGLGKEENERLIEAEVEKKEKMHERKENLNEKERKMLGRVSGKETRRMSEEGMRNDEGRKNLMESDVGSKMKECGGEDNLNERKREMLREDSRKETRRMSEEGVRNDGGQKKLRENNIENNENKVDGKENLNKNDKKMLREDSRKETRRMSKEGMRNDEGGKNLMESDVGSKMKECDGKENLNERKREKLREDSRKDTRRMSEEGVRKRKEEEEQNMGNTEVDGVNVKTEKNQTENSPETTGNELRNATRMKTRRTSADSIRNDGEEKKLKADEEVRKKKENERKNGLKENNREGSLIGEEKNESKDVGSKRTRMSDEGVRLEKKLSDATVRDGDEMKWSTSGNTMDCGVLYRGHSSVGNSSQSAMNDIEDLQKRLQQRRLEWISKCGSWKNEYQDGGAVAGSADNQCRRQTVRRRPPSRKRIPTPLPLTVLLPPSSTETSLQQLTTVQLQDLPGCSLSTLGQCINLQYLSMVNCHILCLDGLQPCSQLKYINVQNNDIEYINLKGMTSVQYVDMSRNKLTAVHGFDGLTNLVWLNLAHNNITKLDAGLETLTHLHTLNLSNNQLLSISSLNHTQVALQTLDLSANQLPHMTDLASLELLRTLDVSKNNLSQIPLLKNQVLLSNLQLSDNNLTCVASLGTIWCPLLCQLNLGQNRLTSLPQMEQTQQLESLNVSDNQLTDIQDIVGSMSYCSSLTDIYTTGNPCSEEEGFRDRLETSLPSLQNINGTPVGSRTAVDTASRGTAVNKISSGTAVDSISSVVSVDCEWKQVNDAYKGQVKMFRDAEEKLWEKIKHLNKTDPLNMSSLCDAWVEHCCATNMLAVKCRYWHEHGAPFNSALPQPEIETATAGNTDSVKDEFKRIPVGSTPLETNPVVSCADTNTTTSTTTSTTTTTMTKATMTATTTTTTSTMSTASLSPAKASDNVNISNTSNSSSSERKTVAAIRIQAAWRGFSLRNKLKAALCFAQMAYDENDSEFGEDIDLGVFELAEADLDKEWSPPVAPEVPKRYPVIGLSSLECGTTEHAASVLTNPPNTDTEADTNAMMTMLPGSNWKGLPLNARLPSSQTPLRHQLLSLQPTLASSAAPIMGSLLSQTPPPPPPPRTPSLLSTPPLSTTPVSSSLLLSAALPPRPPLPSRRQAWISPRSVARSSHRVATVGGHNQSQPESETHSQSPDLSLLSQRSESHQQTASSGNISRLTDSQICEEWGFQDPRTAKVMRERAKKMKLNAERRKKLKKLDPQQRFVLFQKLHVLPNVRTSPTKTQHQQQQQQQQMRDYLLQNHHLQLDLPPSSSKLILPTNSTEDESQVKECRTYLWVHTQVPNLYGNDSQHSIGDSVIGKPNRNLEYGQSYSQLSSTIPLDVPRVVSASRGQTVDLTDTSSFSGSSQSRSTGSAKMKQVQLPPILHSPLFVEAQQGSGQPQDSSHQIHQHHRHHHHNNNQKQVRAVERSAGWGCGRRRNMQK